MDIRQLESLRAAIAADAGLEAEAFRLKYLSKKGSISQLFEVFRQLPPDQKKELGKPLNEIKQLAEEHHKLLSSKQADHAKADAGTSKDLSLPEIPDTIGAFHPLTLTRNKFIEIFERLGFNVADGPEIENDWHNFTALNFPENHPAREMQDTFFLDKSAGGSDMLLRTHTSTVQIRLMQSQKPPIRAIMPGRVYRNEAISARAHCIFHQVEGLYIDKNVGFADLKQTLYHFVKEMFGKDTKIRFRPSYFPFTEPSAEIDISCLVCKGDGCAQCKHSGWVELGGSGMVHPNVLSNCGIDPTVYSGFAFGMGIERITNQKYRINDLRLFTENDIRFLQQFKTVI
ncbi:MAG TPA: phenylalanine--tRNA ligase subunit alpha [Cyclobacteriaceae bacterium]|nr:phenylalanine--tRNA ligase subunit alpha [Cyclobacteriaceae bacterium]